MNPFVYYVLAAVLFALGLAALGGAAFGRQLNRRYVLTLVGMGLWAATLLAYMQATGRAAVLQPDVATPAPVAATSPAEVSATVVPPVAEMTATLPISNTQIPALGGRVVFHSDRSGELDIFAMNLDGSDLQQLTDAPGRDFEPIWSPDGQQVVFSSDRDDPDNAYLYIMNADGSDQRRLETSMASDQIGARWSSDGEWILFHSNPLVDGSPRFDIFKIHPDGSGLVNLTNAPGNNFMGDWSPDGKRIVFVSQRDGNRQLYVMNADGSNQVRITDGSWENSLPRWSPDGQYIVFESNRSSTTFSLFTIQPPAENAVGSGASMETTVSSLTHPGFNNSTPTWINDDWMIISSDMNSGNVPNWELYLLKSDVSEIYRLTDSAGMDRFPDWKP